MIMSFGSLGCSGDGGAESNGGTGGQASGSSATGGTSSEAGGSGTSTTSATTSSVPCTNVRPTGTEWDEATCDQWASDTSECDSAWMVDNDYCNESCGRCTPTSSGGPTTDGVTTTSSTTGSSESCPMGTEHTGGQQHCNNDRGEVGNGYSYEYWSDGTGSGCMTVFGDEAAFSATWSNVGDFLARVGLSYDETRTPDQIGTFSSDFAFTGSANETTYIGIYGWSNNPLIEYYIIEDWFGPWRPSFTLEGTITVDGGSYDVYTNVRENAPSIHGTQTFTQYYSVRSEGRQCGHISISEHFSAWADLGLPMGNLYEVKLLVEGLNNGTGEVEFTDANVVVQ